MQEKSLETLENLLADEDTYHQEHKRARTAKRLKDSHTKLLEHVREVGKSGDLSLIVATGRVIVEGDLMRHANSRAMTSSLNTALSETAIIECHISIVDDETKYSVVNETHSLPKKRKGDLPYDDARQACTSHYARLTNLDKAGLDDDEKKIIDARKTAIFNAGKLYTERQAKTLDVDFAKGRRL